MGNVDQRPAWLLGKKKSMSSSHCYCRQHIPGRDVRGPPRAVMTFFRFSGVGWTAEGVRKMSVGKKEREEFLI